MAQVCWDQKVLDLALDEVNGMALCERFQQRFTNDLYLRESSGLMTHLPMEKHVPLDEDTVVVKMPDFMLG